jgi:hypothetical protein
MAESSPQSEYDAIHQAIGDGLDAWSVVERALESLFSTLTSADSWDAHLIMVSIVSFDARLKICNTLMGRHRKNKVAKRWPTLFNKLSRKYPKRSELAHGSVVNYNHRIVWIPYFSEGLMLRRYVVVEDPDNAEPVHVLSAEEIVERAASFRKLASSVSEFSREFREEREKLQASRAQADDQAPPPDQTDHSATEA